MKKMYAIVREDLSKAQQAVQAGHALAEFLIWNDRQDWDNGTLVYLRVPDLQTLENLSIELDNDLEYASFYEPDIGNEMTAIAAVSDGTHFKKLSLMR